MQGMYVLEKGTRSLLSWHLFLRESLKGMRYLRSTFTEVFKFVTTIWAVLIWAGLGPFASTSENTATSQAM